MHCVNAVKRNDAASTPSSTVTVVSERDAARLVRSAAQSVASAYEVRFEVSARRCMEITPFAASTTYQRSSLPLMVS